MNMKMKISPPPRSSAKKHFTVRELERHFRFKSLEELLLLLRKYSMNGYFNYSIFVSSEYLEWEAARKKVQNGMGVFEPVDPYGFMKHRNLHGLILPDSKIKNEQPLSDNEISEILQKLPIDMVERYLRFKLWDIDLASMAKLYIEDNNLITKYKIEEDLGDVEYKGLAARGGSIYYLNNEIIMPFQERQISRIFIEKGGELCFPDDFTNKHASIFNRENYANLNGLLRRQIWEVHTKLRAEIGRDCIFNTPKEGWSLKL